AACLAVYGATRSISLDDFDSFNFARAIDHFDVRRNQPHPPGYPLYVFLARLVNLATQHHLAALTILSAVCGAVTVLAFFGLAWDLGAPWAAPLLAAMPLFWLSSEIALSDVPGLCFSVGAVFLLARAAGRPASSYRPIDRRTEQPLGGASLAYLLAGCGATGLAGGVRPQDAIVPLSVLVFYTLPLWVRRGGMAAAVRWTGLGAAVLIGVCLLWAVPLLASLPSLSSADRTLRSQSSYVASTDSLFARPLTWPNVGERLAQFGSVFGAYFGGPGHAGLAGFVAMLAVAAGLALLFRRRPAVWLALAWLLPYGVFMILVMRPQDPRKILPAVPPLLLLVGLLGSSVNPAAGKMEGGERRVWRAGRVALGFLPATLAIFFAARAYPLIHILDTVKAPPVQAADYIAAHFKPTDTLVIAGSSYNAVTYLLPRYPSFFVESPNVAALNRDLASGGYRHVVYLDKQGPAIPASYVGATTRTFTRDPLVLPKAASVWMAVYEPVSELRPRQFALPRGPVAIGTQQDVRYLLGGWHRPETIAGVQARWTARTSQFRFWVGHPGPSDLRLVGVSFQPGQRLTVLLNGQPAGHLAISQDWAPYNVSLAAALFHPEAINTITLEHAVAVAPFVATDGRSLDRRPLAVAYSSLELRTK
ncbi:MAG: protein O-mannosyl-transferase family, partial [Chloroflexota bacterium]